jgi:hypothetical protein
MPATATLLDRLEDGVSIDESDLAGATVDELRELIAVASERRYPPSLVAAAEHALGAAKTRELAARYVILDRFDTLRRRAGHDYGVGQRTAELRRLERELESAGLRPLTLTLNVCEGDRDLELTALELRTAFDRVSSPRIGRIVAEDYRSSTPATRRTLDTWTRLAEETATAARLELEAAELDAEAIAALGPDVDDAPTIAEQAAEAEADVAASIRSRLLEAEKDRVRALLEELREHVDESAVRSLGGQMYGDGKVVVEFRGVGSTLAPLSADVLVPSGRAYEVGFELGAKASRETAVTVIRTARVEELATLRAELANLETLGGDA